MLNEQRAKRIIATALAASTADETTVSVAAEEATHLRFARNEPSTSGRYTDLTVRVTATFGSRSGTAETSADDDASLIELCARAEALAKLSPEDPEHLPLLGPQRYLNVPAFDEGAMEPAPAELAQAVATCIRAAAEADAVAAGFGVAEATWSAFGTSSGNAGFHRATTAHLTQTVRTADGKGSGWAGDVGRRIGALDAAGSARTAIDKAVRSREPRPLAPGRYPVILEPTCVASLVTLMLDAMDARTADEGRSFFSKPGGGNRLGDRLLPAIDIRSDPAHPVAPGRPWGAEGVPQAPRAWIDRGVVANLEYSRYWASQRASEPVSAPANVLMAGGQGDLAALIRSTQRAVLITSLWYIRSVDPKSLLYTGLTRDGVFMVENGEIAYPLTNFRWNDSPVAVLEGVDAMTAPVHVSPRSSQAANVIVPAIRSAAFELSSVSDAV